MAKTSLLEKRRLEDAVLTRGLHLSLDELQLSLMDVGQKIFETYVMSPLELQNVNDDQSMQAQQ